MFDASGVYIHFKMFTKQYLSKKRMLGLKFRHGVAGRKLMDKCNILLKAETLAPGREKYLHMMKFLLEFIRFSRAIWLPASN